MSLDYVERSLPIGDVRIDDGRNVTLRLLTYARDYRVSDDGQSDYLERWSPAAFRRSFAAEHWRDVPLSYEHDVPTVRRSMPVGVGRRGWEEGDAVMLSGYISATSQGDDLITLLHDQVIRGVSIEARVFGRTPFVGGVEYQMGQLRRVAFTTVPQYDDAELVAIRSEADPPEARPRLAAVQVRLDALTLAAP